MGENGKDTFEEDDSIAWFECEFATYMIRVGYIFSFYARIHSLSRLFEENFVASEAMTAL